MRVEVTPAVCDRGLGAFEECIGDGRGSDTVNG